ncbi:MAG: amidohydrolase [Actinobacteria bacterium]|nr:amidohydrolase [Acidimicrobiia bacterium]MSO17224.1 amidohydrolase [Acidimicrobiia bacterium]PHX59776.1 MAG: amidohydrolase [Actinomycetota bacterium]
MAVAEDLILVSVDDHVVEPSTLFDNHLPAKWKDAAPRSIRKDDGTDVWVFEGNEIPNIGLNAVAGRPPEEYNIEPTSYDMIRKGCYDIHERVLDMNRNGVLGSMCFPSFVQFCGQLFSKSSDLDTSLQLLRAYNDWHIDEWCGTYPGRFIPLSIPPIWDPQLMADEVRRVAKKGCHAVTFSENPFKLGWPHIFGDHWDPFFAACQDEGTIIALHIGSSSTMIEMAPGAPIDVMITLTPLNTMNAATDLLWSPVLRKFPDLQFALSEGGTGWIPYWLERIDYVYHQHHFWTGQDFGDKLPSQVAAEHFNYCFISDRIGIQDRHDVGIDAITWECDYPHSDSTWPNSPEMLTKQLDGVPDSEIAKMTYENAMRIYRFDPFAHRSKEKSTVAALRAEVPN